MSHFIIKFGLIFVFIGLLGRHSLGQGFLHQADSLTLYFPGKSMDKDTYPPAIVFLDGYLMLFPGDFTAHFFHKQDTGYAYQSTIKFWKEEKGQIYWRQAFQFFVAGGKLWGIGDQCLYQYPLTNPKELTKTINLYPPNGQYLADAPYDKVILDLVAANTYRLYVPTRNLARCKTLVPSEKVKRKANAGAMFATFDLVLDEDPKVVDREGLGINMQSDTAGFANYHYPWLREGNIATDGHQIFYANHASDKIRCFDLHGAFVDSINAPGNAMPINYLKSPSKLTRAAVSLSIDSSGYYGNLMITEDRKYIARQYALQKGIDGTRSSYLQLIDIASKRISEFELPKRLNYLTMEKNQLFCVSDWDFSKGFVKIQFFDIHLPDPIH
jgi:hypothetical protein